MRKILLITIGLSVGLMADFVRDADTNIVTDSATGLRWQDDPTPSGTSWQGAIDYCEALTLGGESDWRLPNLNELTSIVDDTVYNPSISSVFVNTASNGYWSSTTFAGSTGYAWIVNFYYGTQGRSNKTTSGYVRCVRAGQ